jgi:putative copper export protein
MQTLAFIEVLLLGVWLGSMIFFSFVVAPTAFKVLPTRHLAGEMVNNSIGKLELLGIALGLALVLVQLASWSASAAGMGAKVLRLVCVVLMLVAASASRFWLSPAMSKLRSEMGGIIDNVPANDALRVQFDHLHQYSVSLMSVAMLSGIVALFLAVRAWFSR